jgi:nucleoside phosphorylase
MNNSTTDTVVLNRHTDIGATPPASVTTEAFEKAPPQLPLIDWSLINQQAPVRIPINARQPDDPLPVADWVVITWTSAEWQALDHVFLNSNNNLPTAEWRKEWQLYTRGASSFVADAKSGTLWGYFQLVQITDQSKRNWRVLLFKSNAHLAHSPWIDGLSAMMKCILTDTKATVVYTIGTAGGARLNQCLGDAVITNSAILELQRPQNTHDSGDGNAYRCPSWYPSTGLVAGVQDNLLFKLNTVVTRTALEALFKQLQDKHAGDSSVSSLKLDDLLNEGLDPETLGAPKVQSLKDVPLLTTDFYYIANGNSADAFSFLEMDDAIIIREANAMGVRVACIRNISDPVVPDKTKQGVDISDSVRGDWSGLIYTNFGLYTSFNGALATWATIAGEGSAVYNPKRFTSSPNADDPLEVKLAYEVRSCGTCTFFWPEDKQKAVYGPYTAFDFDVNVPYPAEPVHGSTTSPWIMGRTRPPSFPNGEIVDGCRKAPIMTIGINPNLTAFAPGQNGAAWAYPDFSSDDNTNAWAKYAWYYRYRSVYQEKLTLDFIKKYILPDGQIIAAADGKIISAPRPDENPSWSIKVQYTGHADETTITLPGAVGDFPYVLLFDTFEPTNTFSAGDVLAAKLAVPGGIQTEVYQEQQGYYMQFVPTLAQFQDYLREKGHTKASLRIGEDVSQLDMVACASPHWTEGFLGNELKTVVNNCVSKNAWAIKQFVQSKPAVLFIVSESSWNMFNEAVGKFVEPGKISAYPADQSYTLLRETTNLNNPVYINFDITIDGIPYKSKTRLVITPHFSFNTNFLPQYRLSPADFATVSALPGFDTSINSEAGFTILPADPAHPAYYREIQLQTASAEKSRDTLKQNNPDLFNRLEPFYYDAHALMAAVLKKMYDDGELSYDDTKNYLNRTAGACRFCVNQYWQLPNECRYGKNTETPPPPGYLEKVAAYIAANGKQELHHTPTDSTK